MTLIDSRNGKNGTLGPAPGPVCSVCPLFATCRSVCEPVESLLPSVERGRVDPEDLPRIFMGIRFTNLLLDKVHMLTPHQQEVVRLYYRETLPQREIASLLNVTQQAVNDTLMRARQVIGRECKRQLSTTRLGSAQEGGGTKARRTGHEENRGVIAHTRHPD